MKLQTMKSQLISTGSAIAGSSGGKNKDRKFRGGEINLGGGKTLGDSSTIFQPYKRKFQQGA